MLRAPRAHKKISARGNASSTPRGRTPKRAHSRWLGFCCAGRMLRTSRSPFALFSSLAALAFAILPIAACSTANDGSGAPASCSGLDTKVRAQATLRAYAEAVTSLRERALEVEGKFLAV